VFTGITDYIIVTNVTYQGFVASDSLVYVVLDGKEVVRHGLEGELVQERGDRVKPSVNNQQLGPILLGALGGKYGMSVVCGLLKKLY